MAFEGGRTGGGPGRRQGPDTDEGVTAEALAAAPAWLVADKGGPAAGFDGLVVGDCASMSVALGMLLAEAAAVSVSAGVVRCAVLEAADVCGIATVTGCGLRGVDSADVGLDIVVDPGFVELFASLATDSRESCGGIGMVVLVTWAGTKGRVMSQMGAEEPVAVSGPAAARELNSFVSAAGKLA